MILGVQGRLKRSDTAALGIGDLRSETGITEPGATEYFSFHRKRYAFLIRTLSPLLHPGTRVLDVGMSALSRMLPCRFPQITLSTLGFVDERYWAHGEWDHFKCDLNDADFPWDSVGKFDVIIVAEVIEHLYTPPQRILRIFRSLLGTGGHLVIQTPNAASLEKRLKLLCGQNPYEMIRENSVNPGHFREYTIQEMRNLAQCAGFEVVSLSVANYFNHPGVRSRLYIRVCDLLPRAFRDGITILLKAL